MLAGTGTVDLAYLGRADADGSRPVLHRPAGQPQRQRTSDVPATAELYEDRLARVHQEIRVRKTRWVVLRWPNGMAQLAEMSTEGFEDFYFRVCTLDYARMSRAMVPLVELMQRTDRVRLRGPGDTDLAFSIKGMPAIGCDGKLNVPDGEVFTAPVRDSINGVIRYNTPPLYHGVTHNDVRFVFRDGRIVEASSTQPHHLLEILDTDQGARYVGEFAIGFNPCCTRAMKDILFDEKIAGSIHLTPGESYEEADNGNHSMIHWDLVLRQTPDAGGGEMYFDDRLVRRTGVRPAELEPLNPENLL